ncbi:hypothetical protein BBP40_005053 [Aspergillus hancockii]|nr:hypothetical protein BBP40_005053 [Aspergillus hancockii]
MFAAIIPAIHTGPTPKTAIVDPICTQRILITHPAPVRNSQPRAAKRRSGPSGGTLTTDVLCDYCMAHKGALTEEAGPYVFSILVLDYASSIQAPARDIQGNKGVTNMRDGRPHILHMSRRS